MSRTVDGIVGEVVVSRRPQCMTIYRLFARSLAGTTAQQNLKDAEDGIPPQNVRPTPPTPPPPPEPEFSCVSTRSITPRRAYTGSHAPEAPDPLTCCGSGCADCVWIVYGTQLMHYYSDRPLDEALRMIDEQIPNVCMREYVKGELRAKARNRTSF